MSDLDSILAAIATLQTKVEWLVSVERHRLGTELSYQMESKVEDYANDPEPEPVVEQAPPSVQSVCTHGQQVLVSGNIQCAKCGHVLGTSGVVGLDPRATDHFGTAAK